MKKPDLMIALFLVILTLGVGSAFYFQNTDRTLPSSDRPASGNPVQGFTAMWVSQAVNVDEVSKEANLIVRVRVVKSPEPRIIRETLPQVEVVNGVTRVVGEEVSEAVFSDTMFEVIETYAGKSDPQIMVVQTGGPNPQNPENITQMMDDPLYQLGEEYVLFLVDISGDSVQAPDRTLYRIVSPSGRYKIENDTVQSYAEKTHDSAARIPTTLVDLVAQISSSTK